jgi:UDP-N-acetylmuramoyl-L-alanyl-D-glutamate--2,6-diaminopimelate ligase
MSAVPHAVTYGLTHGDAQPKNLAIRADGSSYDVTLGGTTYHIDCNIPGEFNVMNSLAAVTVGHSLGLPKEAIEQGIAKLESVEGRMNTIVCGQKYNAIIDFAHTPDAFERLLSDLRKATRGKLVAVFGSAGRRDEQKRYEQGQIAGNYCDELVLTEEDDRDEDGIKILGQIAEGAAKSGKSVDKDVFLKLDRPEAIAFALTRVSSPDDTVIFLGKGHEKTIERADGEHPWNEREEVEKAIKKNL